MFGAIGKAIGGIAKGVTKAVDSVADLGGGVLKAAGKVGGFVSKMANNPLVKMALVGVGVPPMLVETIGKYAGMVEGLGSGNPASILGVDSFLKGKGLDITPFNVIKPMAPIIGKAKEPDVLGALSKAGLTAPFDNINIPGLGNVGQIFGKVGSFEQALGLGGQTEKSALPKINLGGLFS